MLGKSKLYDRIAYLESLLEKEGHVHDYIVTKSVINTHLSCLSGFEIIYDVTKICTKCQKRFVFEKRV